MQKHASSCTIPTMPTPTVQPHRMTAKEYFQFRRDQIHIDIAADLETRVNQVNSYSPEQLQALIVQDARAKQLEPEDSDAARAAKSKSLRDALAAEFERTKNSQLAQVAADEKDRQANISQIEPGSWVTVHWLLPYRDYGKKKQRAATISGEVKSVDLNRGQVSFVCNSRPDDDEIKLHHIEKDSLVEAPMDSITSVTL